MERLGYKYKYGNHQQGVGVGHLKREGKERKMFIISMPQRTPYLEVGKKSQQRRLERDLSK